MAGRLIIKKKKHMNGWRNGTFRLKQWVTVGWNRWLEKGGDCGWGFEGRGRTS